MRLGELTRQDDGLLGFFVDDDYLHVPRRRQGRRVSPHSRRGRGKGQLGTYGETPPTTPEVVPIDNDYVVAEDELRIHPGQTIALTLLMHPGRPCAPHVRRAPRKSLQLQRDWVAPGLAVMAPSARVGPVLVDPAKISLPLISVVPARTSCSRRRDSPLTWKDDPILAATQTALLPDLPHEVQEGYIRVAPATTPPASTDGA